jgi:hypothetical protein
MRNTFAKVFRIFKGGIETPFGVFLWNPTPFLSTRKEMVLECVSYPPQKAIVKKRNTKKLPPVLVTGGSFL